MSPFARAARPHPRTAMLRIDPLRSPLHTLPPDLRGPILALLGQHADGAVAREGRRWVPVALPSGQEAPAHLAVGSSAR